MERVPKKNRLSQKNESKVKRSYGESYQHLLSTPFIFFYISDKKFFHSYEFN